MSFLCFPVRTNKTFIFKEYFIWVLVLSWGGKWNVNIQSVDIALVFLALILQYNQFVKVHLSLATAGMSLSDTEDQKSNPS